MCVVSCDDQDLNGLPQTCKDPRKFCYETKSFASFEKSFPQKCPDSRKVRLFPRPQVVSKLPHCIVVVS